MLRKVAGGFPPPFLRPPDEGASTPPPAANQVGSKTQSQSMRVVTNRIKAHKERDCMKDSLHTRRVHGR